jgi:serine/threonine protein kinase
MLILPCRRPEPYKILTAIPAGGMMEVYRAHDSKLGRDVAIKILPHAFAPNSELLSHFQREPKILAALNHTNNCTIFEIAEAKGQQFIALEWLEGQRLMSLIRGVTSTRTTYGKDKANEPCRTVIGMAGHDSGYSCDC